MHRGIFVFLLTLTAVLVEASLRLPRAAQTANAAPPKDEMLEKVCRRNPDFMFCKQYLKGERGDASAMPFPHLTSEKKDKKRLLIIENKFYPNGTVKIPNEVTLDEKNEAELAQIKKVDHSIWQAGNNWGFGEAPELPKEAPRLSGNGKDSQNASATDGTESEVENEKFDFALPPPKQQALEIPLPSKLPDHRLEAVDEHNGVLNGIAKVDVGANVGVNAVPGNDPVRVGARVGVDLGASGLAGRLPYGFPFQGERYSLNDYDGNKADIVPDRALKYYRARYIQYIQALQKQRENQRQQSADAQTNLQNPFQSRRAL